MISFGREVCGDAELASRREWLVTNSIGGYASGTISGVLSRSYHGLLIAAFDPPLGRTLLLTKLDETATYDGRPYPLFMNRWASGSADLQGYRYLERFHLEGTIPVWTYALSDARLEKRVWMQPGANTTYIEYTYARPGPGGLPHSRPLHLQLKAVVNYRDHHAVTQSTGALQVRGTPVHHGLRMQPALWVNGQLGPPARPFYLFAPGARIRPVQEWHLDYFLSAEARRGGRAVEDHLLGGVIEITLHPGERLAVIASAEADLEVDGLDSRQAYQERQAYERGLLDLGTASLNHPVPEAQQLILAADQFIVRRASPAEPEGYSVIAGYPWFSDWGRDTMIALPGLALATGRHEIARRILRTFAAFVDRGMLPNRFPDEGEAPEYNTADATLWYFEAIRRYFEATGDRSLLEELFPVMNEIITWHLKGTRYQIHVDPQDGLLYAGEPGVQLTWMDAKVDDWVVTPRVGKAVEINALWYNALEILAEIAGRLGQPADEYRDIAAQARASFERFWNPERGYCFDVIDGPEGGCDPSLRPNQLFAVSLTYSPLDLARQRQVVDACARYLLTSHGLRSLAPFEPGYRGRYGGDRVQRDSAYHQGTVWGWLIGPFVSAHLKVYGDPQLALSYVQPLLGQLNDHGVGSLSEIFDGDPPFGPHGCIAQAWTVGEVLRVLAEIACYGGKQAGGNPDDETT